MATPPNHSERIARSLRSLEGLSVGDAFGDRFFTSPHLVQGLIEARALPAGRWSITDDSVMALSVVDVLTEHGDVDQDRLAELFGARCENRVDLQGSLFGSELPPVRDVKEDSLTCLRAPACT